MHLNDLKLEEQAVIESICCATDAVTRINELGLRPGKTVRLVQKTPLGGPIIIQIDNSLIALRSEEAKCIHLKK